jgi:hypothetical protein
MLIDDIQSKLLRVDVGNVHLMTRAVSGGRRGSTDLIGGDQKLINWSFTTGEKPGEEGRYGPIPPGLYVCHYEPNHVSLGGQVVRLDQTVTSVLAGVQVDPIEQFMAEHRDLIGQFGKRGQGPFRPHGRSDFFIHGRGPKGSHGCIVVYNATDRHQLNKAVKQHDGVLLQVINPYLPQDVSPPSGTAAA